MSNRRELEQQANDLLSIAGEGFLLMSEDVMDQADNMQLDEAAECETLYKCIGCDFPHRSEQQALNCCLPVLVYACLVCGGFDNDREGAIDCCR